jgi:electron transfer flavoprotein beta subunit
MNIVVCIKQVPDSQNITIDPVRKTLNREGAKAVINPPDENGVELGISMKEKYGGTVTVITMGPPQAHVALRETVARGADESILLTDKAFAGADTYPTSLTLAATIKKLNPDLIICGEETTDSSTGQVGPGIAEHLGLPQATYITELSFDEKTNKFKARRTVEGGYEILEFPAPALVSVALNMNKPRIATLKGKIRAKRYNLPTWTHETIDLPKEWIGFFGSPTWVVRIRTEEEKEKDTVFIEGHPRETADKLVSHLRGRL